MNTNEAVRGYVVVWKEKTDDGKDRADGRREFQIVDHVTRSEAQAKAQDYAARLRRLDIAACVEPF